MSIQTSSYPSSSGANDGRSALDLTNVLLFPPRQSAPDNPIRRYRLEILLAGVVLSWGLLGLPVYILLRLI